MVDSKQFFIAVHVGAGFHTERKNHAYKHAMRSACKRAAAVLNKGGSAEDACVAAIKALETSQVCNAGIGSNLTETGCVECDASIMSGDGVFGAIGATAGVAHPIEAAHMLAAESREPMPLGRVRPIFLTGDGARQYALSRGLLAAMSAEEARHWNIARDALSAWNRFRVLVEQTAKLQQFDRLLHEQPAAGVQGGAAGVRPPRLFPMHAPARQVHKTARSNADVQSAFHSTGGAPWSPWGYEAPRNAGRGSYFTAPARRVRARDHPYTAAVPYTHKRSWSHQDRQWCDMRHLKGMVHDGGSDDPYEVHPLPEQALSRHRYRDVPSSEELGAYGEAGYGEAHGAGPPPAWACARRHPHGGWWEGAHMSDGPPAYGYDHVPSGHGALGPGHHSHAWADPYGAYHDPPGRGYPPHAAAAAASHPWGEAPWQAGHAPDRRHLVLQQPAYYGPSSHGPYAPPAPTPSAHHAHVSPWPGHAPGGPSAYDEPGAWVDEERCTRDPEANAEPSSPDDTSNDDGQVVESRCHKRRAPHPLAAGRRAGVPAFLSQHTAAATAHQGTHEVHTDGAADDWDAAAVPHSHRPGELPYSGPWPASGEFGGAGKRYSAMPAMQANRSPWWRQLPATAAPSIYHANLHAEHAHPGAAPPARQAAPRRHRDSAGPISVRRRHSSGKTAAADPAAAAPRVPVSLAPQQSALAPAADMFAACGDAYGEPHHAWNAAAYTEGQRRAHEQLAREQAAAMKDYAALLPPHTLWEFRQECTRQRRQLSAEHQDHNRREREQRSRGGGGGGGGAPLPAHMPDSDARMSTTGARRADPPRADSGPELGEGGPRRGAGRADGPQAADPSATHTSPSDKAPEHHATQTYPAFAQRHLNCEEVYDTVGAAVVDCHGNVAAGVSSGGIAMKMDGRVGDSAVFGCGVWAANPGEGAAGQPGVAATTTGVGENIIRTMLAKRCAESVLDYPDDLPMDQVISKNIVEGVKQCPPPHDVGVLAVLVDKQRSDAIKVRMTVVHTAASMGVGYYSSDGKRSELNVEMLRQINRLPSGTASGDLGICVFGTNTEWKQQQSA